MNIRKVISSMALGDDRGTDLEMEDKIVGGEEVHHL